MKETEILKIEIELLREELNNLIEKSYSSDNNFCNKILRLNKKLDKLIATYTIKNLI